MKKHNFQQSLAKSERKEVDYFWWNIYRNYFRNMITWSTARGKCNVQFMGIDRTILLDNGRTIYIDEKTRERTYRDILLEYESNSTTGSKGWMDKDLAIDYLAYGFLDSRLAKIYDWRVLKLIWEHNKRDFIRDFDTIEAQNEGYITRSVAVPIALLDELYGAATSMQLI